MIEGSPTMHLAPCGISYSLRQKYIRKIIVFINVQGGLSFYKVLVSGQFENVGLISSP